VTPRVLASLVYCGAAFGGAFLFMRLAAPELPAMVVAFCRVSIASLLLVPLVGRERLAVIVRDWRDYIVPGIFMAAAPFVLFAFAERSITAGLGSILNATTPLWTALLLAAVMRQAPAPKRIAAIAVGFAGVGIIVGLEGISLSEGALFGVIAATVGAACYGVALIWIRIRMTPRPPLELAHGQLIVATVLLLPFAALTVGDAAPSPESLVAIAGIAIFPTAIAWPVLFGLNRAVGPMATSTVTFLNPIFGVLWGAIFLGETVSPTLIGGTLLVFVALALILDVRLPAALSPRRAASVVSEVAAPEE
jgi:drug/metabolite transporter (DMT)-like permease